MAKDARKGLSRLRRTPGSSHRISFRCDDAASLGEYAILLGVVAVALIVVITLFKDSIAGSLIRTTATMTVAE